MLPADQTSRGLGLCAFSTGTDVDAGRATALSIPVTGTLLEYRGQRYPLHSGGDGFVRLATPTPPRREDFPDAFEVNDDPLDPWVKLSPDALTARFSQVVTGTWHGVAVKVGERVRRGSNRGMIIVRYDGRNPEEALFAGLTGNQNDGWSAMVASEEIRDLHVETTELPSRCTEVYKITPIGEEIPFAVLTKQGWVRF